MAILSEKEKRAVPKSERGVPGKSGTGSYPMPDAAHAKAAVGLAAMHHGPAFASKIKAKANKLGFGKSKIKGNDNKHDARGPHGGGGLAPTGGTDAGGHAEHEIEDHFGTLKHALRDA
jgi:hypothetical protein